MSDCDHAFARLNKRFWCCRCGADGGPAPSMATPNPSRTDRHPSQRSNDAPSTNANPALIRKENAT